ncbi:MAG: cupin domain-containing protein [Scytonematopsis contorta HA4267-MV1]|jgi:quercetin dioxygenase-like cupin family protein|nr:cupin domain-containing protein [Scytonematopsis contorta HA4267-MV1]
MTSYILDSTKLVYQSGAEAIENPVTGDSMIILQSTHVMGGNSFTAKFTLPPGSHGTPLHYHNNLLETFEVLSGALEMELGEKGNIKVLLPGEVVYVPAGMYHSFRNSSDSEVVFVSSVHPAGEFEQFIRAMYGLAIDGKVNPSGMPKNLLHFALIIQKADLVIVGLPVFIQKVIIGSLAALARLLGMEHSLSKYWI